MSDEAKCGAGRGSDTTGAAARNSRPTFNSKKYRALRQKWRAPIVRWILTGSTRKV